MDALYIYNFSPYLTENIVFQGLMACEPVVRWMHHSRGTETSNVRLGRRNLT